MTALLLQTLLLMVPAFFIGAALACTLRRMMHPAQEAITAPVHARQQSPVEPLPQYAARSAPAASSAASPAGPATAPVAPAVAPAPSVTPVAAQISAVAAANRFDETLKARPADAARTAAAPAATVTPAPATMQAMPKPSEVQARPAPPPPPATPPTIARPASRPAEPTAAPRAATAEMIAGATAAMAAAAAAVTAQVSASPSTAASTGQQAARPLGAPTVAPVETARPPAAAIAPMATVVVAPPTRDTVVPVKPQAVANDDLTRISIIDSALGAQLNQLGITRFNQIAAWRKADVDTVSQSLGFQGRVEQENWIEQAQILAGGGETFYSARRTKAAAPSMPTPTSVAPAPAAAQATPLTPVAASVVPKVEARDSAPKVEARDSAPKVEDRAAFASAQRSPAMPAAPSLPLPVDRVAVPPAIGAAVPPAAPKPAPAVFVAPAPAPAITPAAAVSLQPKEALVSAASAVAAAAAATRIIPTPATSIAPAAVSAASPPSPVAPQAVAVRPTMAPTRDAMQRVSAINGEIEKLLAVQGVTRYSQIAGWGPSEVERFDRLLGSQGRIARENWVEQSQILAKGGDTAYSREHDRRVSDTPRDTAARPKSITDAIKANAGAIAAAAGVAAAIPAATTAVSSRPDIGSLRSVRSEAYRSGVDATTTAAAAAAAGLGSAKVVRSAEIDDLKRIRGIGVLIEKRLNSVGIVSYGQIADWTTDDIDRVSATLDFRGRIERENWVEQARILSAGGQTEFSRRVDRGEVETSKPK